REQTVSVKQEVNYIETFIELQRARASEKLVLETKFDEKLNGQQIYPLLFLPLVENAFKYVGGKSLIRIEAMVNLNEIEFRVENSLPEYHESHKPGGIGLENLRRRLNLLYPGKHRFETGKANHRWVA